MPQLDDREEDFYPYRDVAKDEFKFANGKFIIPQINIPRMTYVITDYGNAIFFIDENDKGNAADQQIAWVYLQWPLLDRLVPVKLVIPRGIHNQTKIQGYVLAAYGATNEHLKKFS